MVILLAGCKKSSMQIDFDLPPSVNANYRLVCYASNKHGGAVIELFAPVENGKFHINAPASSPMIVYIFSGSSSPVAAFYAEGGDKILISGDSPDPISWKFSGNKISEQWSDWVQKNRDTLSSRDAARINGIVEKFVKENPDSPLSTIFLLHYFSRRDDNDRFVRLWATLDEDALNGDVLDIIPRSDVLDGTTASHDIPQTMVLSTLGNGADTVRTSGKPSLLSFRSSYANASSQILTVLQKIALDFPDSASRNIVDISFNPDLKAWEREAPRDSLRKIINACMPLGTSDSLAVVLDVKRTPFFIVIGKNGKTAYRGDEIDKAESSFRNLLNAGRQQ